MIRRAPRAAHRMWGRVWPWVYVANAGMVVVAGWETPSLLVLRWSLTVMSVAAALWFCFHRSAERAVQRCIRRHSQWEVPCGTCRHHACDGEICGSCEGPCTAPPGVRLLRPHVPSQHTYWLN